MKGKYNDSLVTARDTVLTYMVRRHWISWRKWPRTRSCWEIESLEKYVRPYRRRFYATLWASSYRKTGFDQQMLICRCFATTMSELEKTRARLRPEAGIGDVIIYHPSYHVPQWSIENKKKLTKHGRLSSLLKSVSDTECYSWLLPLLNDPCWQPYQLPEECGIMSRTVYTVRVPPSDQW